MNFFFFFFNDTATTEIYTLSLHDALPISFRRTELDPNNANPLAGIPSRNNIVAKFNNEMTAILQQSLSDKQDRKSTRLNSSHLVISYAVFCLKKKTRRRPCRSTSHSPRLP